MGCSERWEEDVYPKPLGTFGPEAEALETKADAGGAAAIGIHLLVAFLGGGFRVAKGERTKGGPCGVFCRCNSRTWRAQRLLTWALRSSLPEGTLVLGALSCKGGEEGGEVRYEGVAGTGYAL